MNDLKTIQKMNSLPGVAKLRARALAMNSSEGHQKKRVACKRCDGKRRVPKTLQVQGKPFPVLVACPDCFFPVEA